jgi:hypothetical protein
MCPVSTRYVLLGSVMLISFTVDSGCIFQQVHALSLRILGLSFCNCRGHGKRLLFSTQRVSRCPSLV